MSAPLIFNGEHFLNDPHSTSEVGEREREREREREIDAVVKNSPLHCRELQYEVHCECMTPSCQWLPSHDTLFRKLARLTHTHNRRLGLVAYAIFLSFLFGFYLLT